MTYMKNSLIYQRGHKRKADIGILCASARLFFYIYVLNAGVRYGIIILEECKFRTLQRSDFYGYLRNNK